MIRGTTIDTIAVGVRDTRPPCSVLSAYDGIVNHTVPQFMTGIVRPGKPPIVHGPF